METTNVKCTECGGSGTTGKLVMNSTYCGPESCRQCAGFGEIPVAALTEKQKHNELEQADEQDAE